MVRWIRRYGMATVLPLCILALAVGCRSTGHHGRGDPCSGCGSNYQPTQQYGHVSDSHNHAHN